MPSFVTPKKNTQFIFYISLVSQANTKLMQVNPTIAAGDFKVAKDDEAPGNLGIIPVVDGDFTKRVKVTLAFGEMNGDNITFIASDVAGNEWCDLTINFQTTAGQIDDLAKTGADSDTLETLSDEIATRAPSGEYDTELDTNISTRAPASEYDTEMARITANVATEAKQDTAQTELDKIGTIPALDGGAQTIGAAIAKLADDNGGATFNAGEDSLNKIRNDRTLPVADYVVVGDTIAGVTAVTDVTGDVKGNVDGTVAGKTPAEAGDAMNLAADAIKAISYDESTAYPVKSNDAGVTQIARVGADGDTLETLSDQIDGIDTKIGTIPALDGAGQNIGAAIGKLVDDNAGADFDAGTDSLQALRDRGDAAWITGGGGGITDILNIQPLIPNNIDLANTVAIRLALGLTNMLDDLPITGEITPGTISIDRKAIGGTSWSNIINNSACSEAAGIVYFDEVFDVGAGYAEGDSIRITFKNQKITVAANDYEITDGTGWIFQTSIRQTMRGTDSASAVDGLTVGQFIALK